MSKSEEKPFSLQEEKPGPVGQLLGELLINRLIPAFLHYCER